MEASKELLGMYPAVIPFRFPGIPGVKVFFTTGLYGNISLDFDLSGEADKARRVRLPTLFGFERWTELKQVHGTTMLVEPEPTPFESPSKIEADGSCTSRPGHALLSKAADCQQIMLAHKSGKYVAALHCGWKGNTLNFPKVGLMKFCETYGIEPAEVMAVRGPSLGPGCAEFVNFDREWPDEFRPWFNPETQSVDLWSLTRHQLAEAGMLPGNILGLDLCTRAFPDLLFSYRRGHSGRQGALIFIDS